MSETITKDFKFTSLGGSKKFLKFKRIKFSGKVVKNIKLALSKKDLQTNK